MARRQDTFLPASRRDLLARLLWNLARRGWKGTVHLAQGGKHWSVTLAGRRVRGLDIWNAKDLRLGNLLHSIGQASLHETNLAAELARRQCRLAGQVLTDQGLPGPMLAQALKMQARMRFARFMDKAEGLIRLDPDARIPARASLGKPMDLAQALFDWANANGPEMAATRQRTWHIRWEAMGRSGQDLVTLLPPVLHRLAEQWLAEGLLSWQDLHRELVHNTRLGVSFLEILWSWFNLLEHLGLAVSEQGSPKVGRAGEPATKSEVPLSSKETWKGPKRGSLPAVPQGADPETLRRWWHQMARRYHPDSNPTADPEAFHQARRQYLAALARFHQQT